MVKTLSVALAVFNEEKNISACLSSVADIADEIIVVDGGSTDKTIEIAKQFKAKVIQTTNPPIFHINKQKALQATTSGWILQLDADEVVTPELKKEILSVMDSSKSGFYIPRKNYFWGHFMKKGGQYPDYVIRLIRRGKGKFPSKSVHEQIEVDGEVGYLKHPMLHYSYRTRHDYWKKANAYTSLTAKELKAPKTIGSYLFYTFWKPIGTFLNIYVRHKGFVDGLAGFEFALYSGLHWAMAYKKYIAILIICCALFIAPVVHADYVLPYPSYMPGNKIYKITRVVDKLKAYWYFGNLAQAKYHLSLSDKYLVEAKTLFEYKQYLLASDALLRSDNEFVQITQYIRNASARGVDMTEFNKILYEASITHEKILESLILITPSEFTWAPEKSEATSLAIHDLIMRSSESRQKIRKEKLP